MKTSTLGEIARIFTESAYVRGISINYTNDIEFKEKVNTLHSKLQEIVGYFCNNHYAIEVEMDDHSSIFIGINNTVMTIGSTCHSDGEVYELTPKDRDNIKIHFNFKEVVNILI